MELIKITIPDDLTPEQEMLAIGKKLGKKMLPQNNQPMLGNGYTIKPLKTAIVIERKSMVKPIVTRECPICHTLFDQSIGKSFWHNYGGKPTKKYVCCEECRQEYMSFIPGNRCSIKRSKLQPIRTF